MKPFDLTPEELANLRAAIQFLRVRCGGWEPLAKALRVNKHTIWGNPGPMVAFKIARVAGVGVDDVLAGRYPPEGVCRHCGHAQGNVPTAG